MSRLSSLFPLGRPALVLAPMQEITDLDFWKILHHYGGPDIYFTEYFRTHRDSTPEKYIVQCIRENPSGRPVIAQMIGEHIPSLVRTAQFLQTLPIVAIDLNMGCPAPVVCRKSAGGGLLKNLAHVREIVRALRESISIGFTVKTRIGFESPEEFEAILETLIDSQIDALTVHGRTVKEMYRSHVHYDRIQRAVALVPFPVFANGSILSPGTAREVTTQTHAAGLMIGRGCIRSPWIFQQIRESFTEGGVRTQPRLRDVLDYVERLYAANNGPTFSEANRISRMKKYMTFIAQGIAEGVFWEELRRVTTEADFFRLCRQYLDHDEPFPIEMPTRHLINSGNPRTECHA